MFQISQIAIEDVDRSSTLNISDVGKFCIVVCGCFMLYDTVEQAELAQSALLKTVQP